MNMEEKNHTKKNIDLEFERIKKTYKDYERELLQEGKNLFWTTDKGIYGTADMDNFFEWCKKINLEKYDKFLDLGSGEGRLVLIASLFTNAKGIEYDEKLVKKGTQVREMLGIGSDRCKLLCGNYMEHDIKEYDIIFVNPDKGFMWGLDNKLSKELKGELWVYNQVFAPNALEKDEKLWIGQIPITKYTNEHE